MPTDESTSSSDSNESPQESTSSRFQMSLIAGHNIWEWLFLVVATWNVALMFAASGAALAQCELRHSLLSPEFSTEIIVLLTAGIALLFAFYGVHQEHKYDIFLHVVFIIIADFFSYLAAQKNCYSFFKHICFYFCAALTLINCVTAYKATNAPDWTEFRIIGASQCLADMYKKQCQFLSLLKFDALFVVICAVFSFPITLEFPNIRNLYLLISLIIMYSFMSWCCGKVTVCKEDKYLASGFVVLCITYPCLITYQIYMSQIHKTSFENHMFYQDAQYIGVIIVACKFLLSCLMIQTCQTFGYGLNTRSLDVLKKWLGRPSKDKTALEKHLWIKFLKECCRLKCSNKDKELEYTYKDIYRF